MLYLFIIDIVVNKIIFCRNYYVDNCYGKNNNIFYLKCK